MDLMLLLLLLSVLLLPIAVALYWSVLRLLWGHFLSISGYRWFASSATAMLFSGPPIFLWPTTRGKTVLAAIFVVSTISSLLSWLKVWRQVHTPRSG